MGKIGTRGPKKGPAKTTMGGSIRTGNLGRSTTAKQSGGPNKDAFKALGRRPLNPGRGGDQRPTS